MSDDKTIETTMEPIRALVMGAGTGDGRETHLIQTPAGQPNIIATYVTPLVGLTARFIVAFLTSIVGLITAGTTTSVIPAHDFKDLLLKCASLSVGIAIVGLMKDLVTVFTSVANSYPLLKA
jgi:hypothetical protein